MKIPEQMLAEKKHKIPEVRCLDEAFKKLEKFGVVGVHFGRKITGQNATKTFSLTCLVQKKTIQSELEKNKIIPKKITIDIDGKKIKITTDVIECKGAFEKQASFWPGDTAIDLTNVNRYATIGLSCLHKDYGEILITAGHFARDIGGVNQIVKIRDSETGQENFQCVVKKYVEEPEVDYSILRPEPASGAGLGRLTDAGISGVYVPTMKSELNTKLYVYIKGAAIGTIYRGFGLIYKPIYGDRTLKLIVTDRVTNPGDSGACLVDKNLKIWGILVGVLGSYSLFMPIMSLMSRENIKI